MQEDDNTVFTLADLADAITTRRIDSETLDHDLKALSKKSKELYKILEEFLDLINNHTTPKDTFDQSTIQSKVDGFTGAYSDTISVAIGLVVKAALDGYKIDSAPSEKEITDGKKLGFGKLIKGLGKKDNGGKT